ncbi:MAG TPA: Fic/DOC family N-terminal domain-containing protein [archaeon]|nr:Fic/DOC family N-terminal domain-containing protein [archaeon]
MKPYKPEKLPLNNIDWTRHVTLIGQANAALARYDGILQSIVNPWVLLSPLLANEAVISSRIEGTQATLKEVLQFEANPKEKIDPEKKADIQEVINYRKAMGEAVEKLKERPLCINLILDLHAVLMQGVRGRHRAPGEFRRSQNYIAPRGKPIEQAIFVPPSPEQVMPAMDNWEKYLHMEEKDPLVQLAVAKAQFELIHPFLDGNGRIGRMLVPIFLYYRKRLSSPMFYISAYLDQNQETYYERLRAISSQGDWNGWIEFFLKAISVQAESNTNKARAILHLYDEMKEKVPEITRSQHAVQIIDFIFSLPIFSTTDFIKDTGISKTSSIRVLNAMKEKKIITSLIQGRGRRPELLMFPELIGIVQSESLM